MTTMQRFFDARAGGRWAVAAALMLTVAACADIKPMEYTEIHEIQPGPGLFSGQDGEFVLYGK